MTEDEAKTKWCPFARRNIQIIDDYTNAVISASSFNRSAKFAEPKCIASNCMTWQWDLFPGYVDKFNPEPLGHCGLVRV